MSDWWRDFSAEASPNLYWQLYKSLAAYRLALREESKSGFSYDWIIRARFDAAWIRPLPPLRTFSDNAVWFGMHYWCVRRLSLGSLPDPKSPLQPCHDRSTYRCKATASPLFNGRIAAAAAKLF